MKKTDGYKAFVIVNPAAGAGVVEKRWKKVKDALSRSLAEFQYEFTLRPGHGWVLAKEALGAGYEMVVAIGGDGTVGEVASAFFEGQYNRSPETVFGFVPLGTGCDLARTLFPGSDIIKLCLGLGGRNYRKIDVGYVSFIDNDGNNRERIFMNVASFGCSGAVAQSITARDKQLGAKLGYQLAAVKTLARYEDKTISVVFDEASGQNLKVTNVAVCNAQYFGGGMWVSPEARIDDSYFDVTIWSGFGLWEFLFKQRMLYNGTHLNEERTTVAKAKSLSAKSKEQVYLELDGEYVGQLPATFRLLPSSLKVKIQG